MLKKVQPKKKAVISRESIITKVKEEYNGNISLASRELKIKRQTLNRWMLNDFGKSKQIKRYVITYAQNNTTVHDEFFQSIMVYIAENPGTELICYRGFYDPKNDSEKIKPEDVWYDNRVRPYLMDSERLLNDNVMIYPARTRPTAIHPLSGYETHTQDKSGIFPHPKLQWRTIPTPGHKMPKILTTTGAITHKNYSKSKAGEKGKQHHILGACIVEIEDDKKFHVRHINAESNGCFYDIAGNSLKYYKPDGIETGHRLSGLFCGDTHLPFVNSMVIKTQRQLINKFKPKRIFLNDVTDFWAQNHHEINNNFMNTAKAAHGLISVEDEVKNVAKFIEELRNESQAHLYIIRSNHDEALERWLNDARIAELGINAPYYHWLSYNKHKSVSKTLSGFTWHNSLEFAVKEHLHCDKDITFLREDESCIFEGIDNGNHGHYGPNGARGTVKGFAKIGVKTNTAHGHSPEILDGAYRAGINCNKLAYAKGPSSWLETDILNYKNGKRTFVTYIDGKYCI